MTTTDAPIARRLTIAISVASAAITIAVIVTAGTVLGWFGPARTPTATESVAADAVAPVPEVPAIEAMTETPPEPAQEPVLIYVNDDSDDDDDDGDDEEERGHEAREHEREHGHDHEDD